MTLSELLKNPNRLISLIKTEIEYTIIYRDSGDDKVLYTISSNGQVVDYASSKRMANKKAKSAEDKHIPTVLKALRKLKKLGLDQAEVTENDNKVLIKSKKSKYTFNNITLKEK